MDHTFSAVACVDANGNIGKTDMGLLWYNPEELKHFKLLTQGHPIVMGRKTWEIIGRPLPERQNIVLTHNENYYSEDALIIHSIDSIKTFPLVDNEVMIIGGLNVWKSTWDLIDTIYLSRLNEVYDECDLAFPEINLSNWDLIKEETYSTFLFSTYKKK